MDHTKQNGISAAEFLKQYDPEQFDRPSVAIDVVLLTILNGQVHTLLIRRAEHPFKGQWGLPGSFLPRAESPEQTAARTLASKAGLSGIYLEQLFTFGAVERDPRMRILSVAYYALVDHERVARIEADHHHLTVAAVEVPWAGETGGPVAARDHTGKELPLAFDHADILGMAIKRIRGKLDYTPIGFQLLPPRFTLYQLQQVHEAILQRPLNKDSFRRRMLNSGQLEATGERQAGVGHRPAELYKFSKQSAV